MGELKCTNEYKIFVEFIQHPLVSRLMGRMRIGNWAFQTKIQPMSCLPGNSLAGITEFPVIKTLRFVSCATDHVILFMHYFLNVVNLKCNVCFSSQIAVETSFFTIFSLFVGGSVWSIRRCSRPRKRGYGCRQNTPHPRRHPEKDRYNGARSGNTRPLQSQTRSSHRKEGTVASRFHHQRTEGTNKTPGMQNCLEKFRFRPNRRHSQGLTSTEEKNYRTHA